MKKTNFTKILHSWSWKSSLQALCCTLLVVLGANLTAQNCMPELNVPIQADGSALLESGYIINPGKVTSVHVENEFGGILPTSQYSVGEGFAIEFENVCYVHHYKVVVKGEDGTCWTTVTFKGNDAPVLTPKIGKVDIYCTVDIATTYPERLPRWRPGISVPCGGSTNVDLDADEWVETYQCDLDADNNDTAKVVIRVWSAYGKSGTRVEARDTFVVFRLPQLTPESFIAPQKDTIHCIVDSVVERTYIPGPCWEALLFRHTDNRLYIYYPLDPLVAAAALEDDDDDNTELAKPLIIRNRGKSNETRIYASDVLENPDAEKVDGRFIYVNDSTTIDEQLQLGVRVFVGDEFLTDGLSYQTIDNSWLYGEGEHGIWIRPCLPGGVIIDTVPDCDRWEDEDCAAKIVLPESPGSEVCDTICLTDINLDPKCFTLLSSKEETLSEGCPTIKKCYYTIKQLCYSGENTCVSDQFDGVTETTAGVFEIEQWKMYLDTLGPILSGAEDAHYSTGSHDCFAQAWAPRVKAKDICSGVHHVKAVIDGVGFQEMELNKADGYWYPKSNARPFRLACGGPYTVYYEAFDSCWNAADTIQANIWVHDKVAPTVVATNGLNISIGEKEVWVDASRFDNGSFDNCGVRHILVRRPDWMTACGVTFDSKTGRPLGNTSVGAYYLDAYDWLANDGELCIARSFDGKRTPVVAGWDAAFRSKTNPKDKHGNPIAVDLGLGGGWAKAVPFCCEDACTDVKVEILVIDKACNYTKGWTTIRLEDKSPVAKAMNFDEVKLTCTAVETNGYEDLFAAAAGTNSEDNAEAFDDLDAVFGKLHKGWRADNGDLLDLDGKVINKSFKYTTNYCKEVVDTIKIADTLHDGFIDWITVYDTTITIEEKDVTGQAGGVYVLCAATCIQDIWDTRNECGVGYITRRWRVFSGCGAHDVTPLEIKQEIYVGAGCELKKSMFDLPAQDTTVCAPLEYDLAGNVVLGLEDLEYLLDDTSCRQLGTTYSDKVFKVQGQDNMYKIHRTWEISDWCTREHLVCEQKIILVDTCSADTIDQSRVQGSVVTAYNGQIQKVQVDATYDDGSVNTYTTTAAGHYQFDLKSNLGVKVTASKDINPENGLNVGDILLIQQHILGDKALTDKYDLIAADVKKDDKINTSDIIEIKKIMLNKASSFEGNTSWRFFNELSGEESFTLNAGTKNMKADFIGVKIGDIHREDGLGADLARSARGAVTLKGIDADLTKGQIADVALSTDVEVEGYQFAIKYDVTKVAVSVSGISADDYNEERAGEIRVLSTGGLDKLNIQVTALADTKISEAVVLGASGDFESLVATSAGLNNADFALGANASFALYAANPNPVKEATTISFNLPEAGNATLTLFDATGKTLKSVSKSYTQGLNTEVINVAELGVTGVVYYQLDTENNSDTKKIVIIE